MKKLLTLEGFLAEKWNTKYPSLIMEGGAAGHMMHPFDDNSLTFGDMKQLVDAALQGNLSFEEAPTEKTDGQNLFVTVKANGSVLFARNKGQMANPINLSQITSMFADHPSAGVRDTFTFAAKDLASALVSLKGADLEDFNDGTSFMNMELIYSGNSNVINYDRDVIQFHGIVHTDGAGNQTGSDSNVARKVQAALSKVEADMQKVFKIIPPQNLVIGKDINFDEKKKYFMDQIQALENKYKLSDSDPVSKYHELWWTELIASTFPDIDKITQAGLVQRWAFDDKKSLNIREVAKQIGASEYKKLQEFEKTDAKKKYKENILPFENIFLELGSVVLKNVSNLLAANPDQEMQRLHTQIRTEADKIKKNGDLSQISKVEAELSRLERIGGIDSIIPSEGLVFKFKGKLYKLTGTFAAINQLMGIIKYGR
jgi:hypothetical protein